ncbi:TetR family transcriptional regulator [Cytobacillus sp. FSL W7-1323]|uniref:TetR family transcriptional regulator n=1 Tax=Cytobacillus kochii TaxID=859143 RepID=A0A248TEY1_9BACI|nr:MULTISPECIES: TetR family transcriptional regulator [Cytobacillus]ASV66723.1 TetR family transcriptional regulator [Cytobacillus kochii]MDQ0186468.1 AcrR family transcriptional regulator [Cytobacillus kochii]MEA1854118.1 TetR family transcriptional regulator [Cytobacillus sp. OWB-43]MED1607833.1 TetR family transcriptional regulator [Cytobacillus kochii]
MPKITFYNLSIEKREKLINAVKQEFSRVPLSQASISNIVKSARIPRGSFYQYFEDKEDAFFYLLEERVKRNQSEVYFLLNKHNGDIFEMMIAFFEKVITEQDENRNFLKNLFLNMTYEVEHEFGRSFNGYETNQQFIQFESKVNKEILHISNQEEFKYLMKILTSVLLRSIIETFSKDQSKEEALRNFKLEITLLKRGLKK